MEKPDNIIRKAGIKEGQTVYDVKVVNGSLVIFAEDVEEAVIQYLVRAGLGTYDQLALARMRYLEGNDYVTTKCLNIVIDQIE